MKIGDVEYQGDKTKAIFYYIADDRVDFRTLIKVLAETFRIRIEMKQIGARAGSRKNRRNRTLWPETVLFYLYYEFCICLHFRSPLSGYLIEPPKTSRTMWKAKMLPQLRSRCLYRRTERFSSNQYSVKYGRWLVIPPKNRYFRQDYVIYS